MNTPLHDLMHRAVEDTAPDLGRISNAARSRGLAIRRRRQALSVVGAALAVAVIALGAGQLGSTTRPGTPAAGTPRPSDSASAPATPSVTPAPVRQVPITGRATVAGLITAVAEVKHGGPDAYKGQESKESSDTYGEIQWHPWDSTGLSVIGINVQPGFESKEIYRCQSWQVRCRILHPTRGATLMTYEEHTPTADHDGIRTVADLLRADGVRVVASSTNGIDLPANRWRITRLRPYLSATDLDLVVSQPWWGPMMDERFEKAGKQLTGYEDLSSDVGVN